jgi:dihydrodipicolinate synthase/N-acetylneuraminate lyase
MLAPSDLSGVLAMMPAFATDDARSLVASDTVAVDRLAEGVGQMVGAGVDLLVTTGSFGEGYNLLPDEFRKIVAATVDTAAGRVPVFAGCVGAGARGIVERISVAQGLGADGVMLGLPNYFPLDTANAIQFYQDVADLFPSISILIYHNPPLFRTGLPVAAVEQLSRIPNIVAMKDSHRDTRNFIELMEITSGRISVFVYAGQYYPYAELGAAGVWSYECWMGPHPILRLRDAVRSGDRVLARQIVREVADPYEGPQPPDLRWRETAGKLAVAAAGYVQPGPLRAPFFHIPAEVQASAQRRAAYWRDLDEKYRTMAIPAVTG